MATACSFLGAAGRLCVLRLPFLGAAGSAVGLSVSCRKKGHESKMEQRVRGSQDLDSLPGLASHPRKCPPGPWG